MSHSYFDDDDDDEFWNHPNLVRSLEQPREVLVCRNHQQPCVYVNGRWACAVLPLRMRCRDPQPMPKRYDISRLLITVEIVSPTTFSLQSYPLYQPLGDALRSRGYPLYGSQVDVFEIPIDDYEHAIHTLLPSVTRTMTIQIDPIPKSVLSLITRKAQHLDISANCVDPELVIPDIWQKLLPFQRESVQSAIGRNGKVLLADDMGLGKTIQCIALLKYYRRDWPIVIACPAALCSHWLQTLKTWLGRDDVKNIEIKHLMSKNELLSTCRLPDIVIISYSLSPTCVDIITSRWDNRWTPGIVVCDESHYLKESGSQRTNALRPWISKAQRAIFISGTPAISRPAELFSTINMLRPGLLGSRIDFAKRYCQGYFDPKTKALRDRGCSHSTELHLVLSNSIMIRHLKKDIMNQLPPKIRHIVSVSSPEILATLHQHQSNLVKSAILSGSGPSHESLALYQLSSKPKIIPACTLISGVLAQNPGPIIVFAHHSAMMDGIQELLTKTSRSFIRVDGSTTGPAKAKAFEAFAQGKVDVALLSILSCCAGLNFASVCSTVVFAELAWTPATHLQAEDRIHRLGQKAAQCDYFYLLVKGTSDDLMWPALRKKLHVLSGALNGAEEEHAFSVSSSTSLGQFL